MNFLFNRSRRTLGAVALMLCSALSLATAVQAQTARTPEFTGAWGPYGAAARGADPKLAPVPASPVVLKPEYAKAYEAQRAAETAANTKGEPLANASALCLPSGMPSMMSVAIYPIEVIQTRKQVTIVAEAFTQVRRIFLDRPQLKI